MKVYIAGTFANRNKLRPVRNQLWEMGHQVVSSWLDETSKPAFMTAEEYQRKLAIKDLCEVSSADLIIVDCESISGGKNCELGFSLRGFHNHIIWTVGDPNNIFQVLVDRHFDTWKDCLKFALEYHPGTKSIDANKVK